jgi:protein-tyrosine phosphatase
MIDIHTHILPGVDDGAETIEDSIQMIRQAIDSGVEVICATPHILNGITPTFQEKINHTFQLLRAQVAERELKIKLTLGSEIYVRQDLDSLKGFSFFSLNQTGRYILMELPLGQLPSGVDRLIYNLQLEGITPIIAHPERSITKKSQLKDIENLVHLGALTQINAGSLLNQFGKLARKMTQLLLKQNLIHIMASDAHNSSACSVAVLPQAFKKVSRLVGKEKAEELVMNNPCQVLKGEKLFANDREMNREDKFAQSGLFIS